MSTTAESLLLGVPMAAAAGLVGCFAVMRRMSLAADALSHVALPGIGMALAFNLHPLIGAVTMLVFGALLVWGLEERTRAATETVIGVVFSAALAVGSLMTRGEDLIDALFGGAGKLTGAESAFVLVTTVAIIAYLLRQRHRLVIALVSRDVARTAGIDVRRLNLLFLEAFALTIALGLRYLGVLLMGALIIIPAATAKRVAVGLSGMLAASVIIAVIASAVGTWLAASSGSDTGPMIVIAAAAMFVLSLAWRRG